MEVGWKWGWDEMGIRNGNGDKDRRTNGVGVGDESGNRDDDRRGHRDSEGDITKEVAWLVTPTEVRRPCGCIRHSQKHLETLFTREEEMV